MATKINAIYDISKVGDTIKFSKYKDGLEDTDEKEYINELKKAIKLLKENNYIIRKKKINEGIEIDYNNNLVKYNSLNQNIVDTSIENNPTNEMIDRIPVWSIFKRKKGMRGDGNPLIYALKNENDWKFRNKKDKENILKQFDIIANKFLKTHSFDITILIPSTNQLNRFIASIITNKNIEILEDVICKLTTEEIDEIVLKKDSKFKKFYGRAFENAYKQLCIFLDKIDNEKMEYFLDII